MALEILVCFNFALPALIYSLPADNLLTKLAHDVPNNILRNPSFCSFTLIWIVLLIPCINKPDSSKDLTIFMIFTSSLDIINIIVHNSKSKGQPD